MDSNKLNYSAWKISSSCFPLKGTMEEKICFLVGYGILAPSQHNTQPWEFGIESNRLIVKPDLKKRLPVGDPKYIGLRISLGACVENIVLAGKALGLRADVTIDSGKARIVFIESAPGDTVVLEAIKNRHSDKDKYSAQPIDPLTFEKINSFKSQGVNITLITDNGMRQDVIETHMGAAERTARDNEFVLELSNWLRTNITRATDGMPGFVSGLSTSKSILLKILLKIWPKIFQSAAGHDRELLASSSFLAVWDTDSLLDDDLINCGRSIEHFWIKATELGLAGQPMFASINDQESNNYLKTHLKIKGVPVFLMRFGYHADNRLRTPRKAIKCK